jgi:hypothetical protein
MLPEETITKVRPLILAMAFEVTSMALFFAAEIEDEESKDPPNEQPPPVDPVDEAEIEARIRG